MLVWVISTPGRLGMPSEASLALSCFFLREQLITKLTKKGLQPINAKRSVKGYEDRAGDPLALFQDILKGGLEKTVTHLVPDQGICSLSIDVSRHNRPRCFKGTTYSHGLEARI